MINFLNAFGNQIVSIFIPLIVFELSGTTEWVGIITFLSATATLVSLFIFGRLADKFGLKKFIHTGLLLSAITVLFQILALPSFLNNLYILIFTRTLFSFCIGIFPPALTAYAYEKSHRIGHFAGMASLGFGIGSLVAGYITNDMMIFILGSVIYLCSLFLSCQIVFPFRVKLKIPWFPKRLIKENIHIYLPILLRHTGATAIWTFYVVYLALFGLSKFEIGILYLLNAGLQYFIMAALDDFDNRKLLSGGLLLSAFVFFAFTFGKTFIHFMPMQILLAFSFSLLYVGSLKELVEKNVEHATVSGLLSSTMYLSYILGSTIGTLISSVAYAQTNNLILSYQYVMYFAAIMTLAGFVISLKKNNKVIRRF